MELDQLMQQHQALQIELDHSKQEATAKNDLYEKTLDKVHQLTRKMEEMASGQAVYIGHKGDKIDEGLAEFLNSRNWDRDKMKALFLRHSKGIYKFGHRKLSLRQDKGNNLQVRVGGGYMDLDNFLKEYSDTAMHIIERRDAITGFQERFQRFQ